MISKEEYKKTYIRMMDSIRNNHKGSPSCEGVPDCDICPLKDACHGIINAPEFIEVVEKWGKEHPEPKNPNDFLTLENMYHVCEALKGLRFYSKVKCEGEGIDIADDFLEAFYNWVRIGKNNESSTND